MITSRMSVAGRHPHEVSMCLLTLAVGCGGLTLDRSVSPTVDDALGAWADAYYVGLIAAAVVTLAGIMLPRLEGPLLERTGLGVLAALFAGYAAALVVRVGSDGVLAAASPIAFAAASIVRIVQIHRGLRQLRMVLTARDDDAD